MDTIHQWAMLLRMLIRGSDFCLAVPSAPLTLPICLEGEV